MLNKSILMGRLTRDPELRYTQSNIPVTSFSIAVDRSFNSGNERQVDFINIVAWRNTAEFVSKWFSKGQLIVVSGRLQVRSYKDRDGNNRTATEVVADEVFFADSKRNDNQATPSFSTETSAGPSFSQDFAAEYEDLGSLNDDDLPF